MSTPEGRVKGKVRAKLKEVEAWAFAPITMGAFGRHGIPDIIACVPTEITQEMVGKTIGAFVAIETKAPGKTKHTTPNQRRELIEIYNAFGVAIVTDDVKDVEEALEHLSHGDADYKVPT
jgi:hypothetical protein